MTEAFLQILGKVFGVPVELTIQILGGPYSIRIATQEGLNLSDIWNTLSAKLYEGIGISLPDLSNGPWGAVMGIKEGTLATPTIYIGPATTNGNGDSGKLTDGTGKPAGKTTASLGIDLSPAITIPKHTTYQYGPFTITVTPQITIHALYLTYDNGLDFKLKISTPTTTGLTDGTLGAAPIPGPDKYQIVTYPFPVPAQSNDDTKAFEFKYLGLGQRVGPNPVFNVDDPMEVIFHQLETQFTATDPTTIIKDLAENFYHPDRDWFVAAHVIVVGWDIKLLFNDPAMYGLRISVPMTQKTPFAGLLFEILYQKLSPNLGVYYGALTLPYLMRRIPLSGIILILPGFSIWIYTNGDFRINVGWPLGDSSIGIQVSVLVGIAGFYFAKLRSGDNPGAQPSVDYNPILLFGIGMSIYVKQSFNASIFSATIAVSVTSTLQGLLAWKADGGTSGPPDHYWFAGTAGLSVLIQGSIDFAILKASVTISLQATVTVAFETGCTTVLAVYAAVSVSVSVKIIFFTITLSFSASISHQFLIGSGPNASINGPIDPDLAPFVPPAISARRLQARAAAEMLMESVAALQGPVAAYRGGRAAIAAASAPAIDLYFFLQPTAVYSSSPPGIELSATLFLEAPGGSPTGNTAFQVLVDALVQWLVDHYSTPGKSWSERLSEVSNELGTGAQAPGPIFGGWAGFSSAIRGFLQNNVVLNIHGVDGSGPPPFTGPSAILPMLDTLTLSYASPGSPSETVIDFATYNLTPLNYPDAVRIYFESLGLSGGAPAISDSFMATQSMASYLLYDYFLLLSRQAINGLIPSAGAYEEVEEQAYFMELEAAGSDPGLIMSAGMSFVTRITGGVGLRALLDDFDYSSAAGLGSRYLLHGLQLPDPDKIPAHPTPDNMRSVPTSGLYTLTGQQFPAIPGATEVTATLSFSAGRSRRSIRFTAAAGTNATARIGIPGTVPPMPDPEWNVLQTAPLQLSGDVITVSPLPPLSAHALYFGLKNQTAWLPLDDGGSRTILPLPPQLMSRLSGGNIRLAVTTDQPDAHLSKLAAHAATSEIDCAPGLLIRITLEQVPAETMGRVGASGSPSTASPASGTTPKFLPFVYQMGGTDEQTRDLIYAAINSDLCHASLQLLYVSSTGSSILQSEALSPGTLIAKTNLSTLNLAESAGPVHLLRAIALQGPPGDFAPITDVKNFLRLLWEVSVVNAPGYFLFYESAAGQDLPGWLFANEGTEGNTGQFQILVSFGQPLPQPQLNASQNCVWIPQAAPKTTLFGAVRNNDGDPVPQWGPTYPAGTIGFLVEWSQTIPSPPPPINVDELYQMLQAAVLPTGGYFGSNWSLPAGPVQPSQNPLSKAVRASDVWTYTVTLPIASFYGQPSPPDHNRYSVIGNPVSTGFRLDDIYGNALPGSHQSVVNPLYNDPLVAFGEWPGVQVHYEIQPQPGEKAALVLLAVFDPESLNPQVSSPPGSPSNGSGDASLQQWQAVLDRYDLILDQLRDPHTKVSVHCSLVDGNGSNFSDLQSELEKFAEDIEVQVRVAMAIASPPPDTPGGAQMVTRSFHTDIPFQAVRTLPRDIIQLSVSVRTERDPNYIDPEVLRRLPSVGSVSYSPGPDIESGSPGGGGLGAFASNFEFAFAGFDGGRGMLKLAQSSGIQVSSSASDLAPLWAVRWSRSAGISVNFDSTEPVYFALRPLNISLINQKSTATGLMYSNVDLDSWAYDFLRAYDSFLLPRNAVAVAILDRKNDTDYFDRLMKAKASLAKSIPRGTANVLVNQASEGDETAARERLEQALLTALSSAFTVSTIIQARADVVAAAPESQGSPGTQPASLWGTMGPPIEGSPASGARQYTLSNAELDILPGERWSTILVSVAQAKDQSDLVLPLWYQVSYMQHNFQKEVDGYVPSSWIKFILAGQAPLLMPVAGGSDVHIPLPLPFYPGLPRLVSQTASAAPLISPTPVFSPGGVEGEIAEALRWNYSVQIGHDWAAQDQLYFTAAFNLPVKQASQRMMVGEQETLFDALSFFIEEYPAISAELASIPAEAYPGSTGGSPGRAGDVIAAFTHAAERVANAWDRHWLPQNKAFLAWGSSNVIKDEFYLAIDFETYTVMFFGRTTEGENPKYWPRLTPEHSAGWSPDRGKAQPSGSPGSWWMLEHTFTKGADFKLLLLEWDRLDVLERQTATLSAYVVRNANLLLDASNPTNPAFVYQTATVEFASPIVPLIQRAALTPMAAAQKLSLQIEMILAPMVRLAFNMNPYLRIGATFEYQLAPPLAPAQQGISASMAVLLADGVRLGEFGSPVPSIARELAEQLGDWHMRVQPSSANALLVLSLSVFGTIQGEQLPLVQIGRIPIMVADVGDDWWS